MSKLYEATIAMSRQTFIFVVALTGCTRPVVPPDLIASTVAGRTAGPPQTCVLTQPHESIRTIDSETVVYGGLSTIYINRLGAPCPGLSKSSTIILHASGSHYCRGDWIRAIEPHAKVPGPTCILGNWVPYRRK